MIGADRIANNPGEGDGILALSLSLSLFLGIALPALSIFFFTASSRAGTFSSEAYPVYSGIPRFERNQNREDLDLGN